MSLLAQVFLLNNKMADALKALSSAASINNELPSVYRNKSRLLLKQSKISEALEQAQAAYARAPLDPEGWLVLGACLVESGRMEEALTLVDKALITKPTYAEAYASRALIRYRALDLPAATADAEMAVSLKLILRKCGDS